MGAVMSVFPEGERVRSAIRWVSAHLLEDPEQAVLPLAHQAAEKFDLTPKESEELIQFYRSAKERDPGADPDVR